MLKAPAAPKDLHRLQQELSSLQTALQQTEGLSGLLAGGVQAASAAAAAARAAKGKPAGAAAVDAAAAAAIDAATAAADDVQALEMELDELEDAVAAVASATEDLDVFIGQEAGDVMSVDAAGGANDSTMEERVLCCPYSHGQSWS